MFSKKKTDDPNWERTTITELAWEGLREQKRARRWRIFFQFIFVAYLLGLLASMMDWGGKDNELGTEHVALIEVKGLISESSEASAEAVNSSLRAAFENPDAKGVIVEINSPGGTPVQAASIYHEMRRLQVEYPDKRLLAVVGDMCASGGYYVAAAASEIYASPSSIVGSIGVRMDSYGATGLAEKLGIERRTLTAGANKSLMDPLLPVDPAQQAHLQRMLGQVHDQFIDAVKQGRGERLQQNEGMFTGLIWSGEEAQSLGLIDHFGDRHVAADSIGTDRIVPYARDKSLLEQFTQGLGAVMITTWQSLALEQKLSTVTWK